MNDSDVQRLGLDSTTYQFDTASDGFDLTLKLVEQARRVIRLVSHDLEKGFYDRDAMVESLSRFARRNRNTQIQILIADVKPLVGQSNALLTLAERLPSKLSIRVMNSEYPNTDSTWLVVDLQGVMYRKSPAVYSGFVNFDDPSRAKQLTDEFEAMWQRAVESPELRRLSL